MKHLLKMMDLSKEEIIDILNLADQLKYELKHGIPHNHLKGKTLGMIFQKAWRISAVPVIFGYADRTRRACSGHGTGSFPLH